MKLAAWAQQVGIHEDTAYKYFHAGCLPVPAVQLPTGTILVQEPTAFTRPPRPARPVVQ